MQSEVLFLLLFSNQLLLPPSLVEYTQCKANIKKRRCIHKELVLHHTVLIVGQKASENGWTLRRGSWKREFDFLKHLLLLLEWILSQDSKLILCLGAVWSLPDILLGFDRNSLPQTGSYIRKNKETHFKLPTMPLCPWLCFLILQSRLNWSHTK